MRYVRPDKPRHRAGLSPFQGGDRMPLITVADAVRIFHTPPGTLRRWIAEDEITGQRDPKLAGLRGRRMVYPCDKLEKAYNRRHGIELVDA